MTRNIEITIGAELREDDPRTPEQIGLIAAALTDTAIRLGWMPGEGKGEDPAAELRGWKNFSETP